MKTFELKDFIKTKENSNVHTEEEINFFIRNLNSFSQDEIAGWLKAVKANGMNDKETSALTMAMANSGVMLTWKDLEPTLDKHSTGGIGDKITLLVLPLLAAYGELYGPPKINIPKLSGRGLGITGGTVDKLESIPGFKTSLSIDQIKEQVKKISLAICSASGDLAPADKKLYAIRDVTNTTDSIPLIASSVMSKKIAGGAQNIILDVKFGSGAFMKKSEDAKLLAQTMVSIGKSLKRKIKAVISNMNQPLGYAVGNALEIKEVLEILSGKEVGDLVEITIGLAKEAITLIDTNVMARHELSEELRKLLLKGGTLAKFEEMVIAQGGNLKAPLKKANHIEIVKSEFDGYIQNIDALVIGEAVHALGAGRKTVSDQIDHSVGVLFYKKYGDRIKKGEPLLEIHSKNKQDTELSKQKLTKAIKYSQAQPSKLKLVEEIVE